MALYYIGGILKHAKALCAICSPTTNSYKRLVPGYEAPVNLAYSARNRSAAIRIPTFSENPKAKRIEYRPPDPSANPYLCYTALLMAGLDGVLNKIDPGEPMDKNLYELPPEELAKVPQSAGQPGRGAGPPGEGPRVPAQGRRVHPGLPGDVDQPQTQGSTTPSACARIPTSSSSTTTFEDEDDLVEERRGLAPRNARTHAAWTPGPRRVSLSPPINPLFAPALPGWPPASAPARI